MRLFAKRRASTLEAQAGDYALSRGAGAGVADCYAEEIVIKDVAGAFGRLAPDHETEWPTWCARNLRECPECREPWAIFVPCVSSWECWDCTFCWKAEAV